MCQIIPNSLRKGGFTEIIVKPERNLISLPNNLTLSIAALAEPISRCWYAVRKAKTVLYKKDKGILALVIWGGAIGLSAALSNSTQGIKTS